MAVVQLFNLGSQGVLKDIPGHLLAPEAWTDGNNMQMIDTYVKRSLGYQQIFGTPSVAPGFIFYVPAASDDFWIYCSLTAAYVYDGVSHTDITRAAGAYTASAYRDWNACILGGVPILNNGADVPQYWSVLSPATDLAALPNWPATLRAKVIRNFGKFLVALNLNDNGTLLPHAIHWSHPADPGTVPSSWDETDATVDAGRTHLTDIQGGEIVDAYLLGNYLVIYKLRSTHLLRFVGGNDILAPDLLFNTGLICARAAAAIDSGFRHFCVGADDIYVHSGTKQIEYPLNEKDRRFFYSDLDSTNFANLFVKDNPVREEVWVCYPSTGATYPNKAMVYNYKTQAVSFREFAGSFADFGSVPVSVGETWDASSGSWDSDSGPWNLPVTRYMLAGDPTATKIWAQELGLAFGTSPGISFLQRTGLAITGRDRQGQPKLDYQSRRLVNRIWPKIRGSAQIQVRIGMQEELEGEITWTPYKVYIPAQKYLDFEISGRLPAVEFLCTEAVAWQIEGYDLNVEVLGAL